MDVVGSLVAVGNFEVLIHIQREHVRNVVASFLVEGGHIRSGRFVPDPQQAIITGKTKGPDVITLEPASLGHLAAGASAIPAWAQESSNLLLTSRSFLARLLRRVEGPRSFGGAGRNRTDA